MLTTLLYFAAFAALGLTGASLGPTLPGLADQVRVSVEQISNLFAARSLGYLVGTFLGGRIVDRFPGHILMGLSLILMAAAMGAVPGLPDLGLLILAVLVVGLGEGGLDVAGNTLLIWRLGQRVGPYMSSLHFFFGVGSVMAPLLVAQVFTRGGTVQWVYWIIAFAVLLPGLLLLSRPSPNPQAVDPAQVTSAPDWRLITPVILFFFVYVGAEVSYGGWIFSYALAANAGSQANAAYLTSAYWLAFTLGRLAVIPFAARLPSRYLLWFGTSGAVLALGLIQLQSQSTLALWAGTLAFGLAISPLFPAMLTSAGERNGTSGRVTSYFFLGATSGGILAPWLIGQLFERLGHQAMMGVIFACMALALVLLIPIHRAA